jgi:hypothetical protein
MTPILVTGDMNDRHDVVCRFAGAGLLTSTNAERQGTACPAVPGDAGIDWIFGSRDVALRGFTRQRLGSVGISDHPLVSTQALVRHTS